MKKVLRMVALLSLAACAVACSEDEKTPEKTPQGGDEQQNIYAVVLNQGMQGANNATISVLTDNNGTIVNDWFSSKNSRGMGDVAQDAVEYGSKVYVTVSESNTIEVIDRVKGTSTQISMGDRYPRYIAAHGSKIYVSCYTPHSVVRIDTTTLAIEGACNLGDFNPEGLAVANDKLFVASSNISDENYNYTYDDKVFEISLTSFSVTDTLTVGSNPQNVLALDANRVVVNYWGNYSDMPAGTAVINATDNSVTQLTKALNNMTVIDGDVYGYEIAYAADWSTVANYAKIDGTTLSASEILSTANINNPYCIAVDPATHDIYVATNGDYSANGDIYCFTNAGAERWHVEAGMLPSKILFY
ncbi:MAG: YncE family protein [Bacteroidales bacterium]|nr:YncE family protein [Bacteroidales bacterium]